MIEIIADHEDFYIVNKPSGVNFHDEGKLGEGFFNQAVSQLSDNSLYPVHRLDKLTSGLVILAKSKSSAAAFQELFSQHQIQKYYLAISCQKPKKKQGTIKGDMSKSRRGAYKLLRTAENPAISSFFSASIGQGVRLFIVKPLTGKTHQIRVALASIASPILGDYLYAKGDDQDADRGYLHAYQLHFNWQGQALSFVCSPTQGQQFLTGPCQEQIEQWKNVEDLPWPK